MVTMPDSHSLALFAGAVIAILLIPGPAVLYIVSQSAEHGRLAGLFTQGVVVKVLNPKTALFFLAFLPQFVDPTRTVWTQVLVPGLTFVVLGFLTDGLYAVTAGTLARWLKQRRRLLRYASGSVFIGLGVSAALAKRT
jgi:threonine/homoserine/homoserine lactone efflux protein